MGDVKIVKFSSHALKSGKKPFTVWAGYKFEGAFASMREAESHAKSITAPPQPTPEAPTG